MQKDSVLVHTVRLASATTSAKHASRFQTLASYRECEPLPNCRSVDGLSALLRCRLIVHQGGGFSVVGGGATSGGLRSLGLSAIPGGTSQMQEGMPTPPAGRGLQRRGPRHRPEFSMCLQSALPTHVHVLSLQSKPSPHVAGAASTTAAPPIKIDLMMFRMRPPFRSDSTAGSFKFYDRRGGWRTQPCGDQNKSQMLFTPIRVVRIPHMHWTRRPQDRDRNLSAI